MSVRLRLLLALSAVIVLVQVGLGWWLIEDLRPRHLVTMEETLVEAAHLVATVAALHWDEPLALQEALAGQTELAQPAEIYGTLKRANRLRVYLTDAEGQVILDSNGADVGADYSRWNNIYRTVRGSYGARATWREPNDPASAVLHVSQPIRIDGRLVGVATVAKPQAGLAPFLGGEQRSRSIGVALALASLVLIAMLVTFWATRPIAQLRAYAEAVGKRRGVAVPTIGPSDLRALRDAFVAMRERIAARHYVERYVQGLTHELKSPLTTIAGAVEILADDPPAVERRRFLTHIGDAVGRLQGLAEKLLHLSSLERQEQMLVAEPIDWQSIVDRLQAERSAALAAKSLRMVSAVDDPAHATGDTALLSLALGNLIDNAIAFAPAGSAIDVEVQREGGGVRIRVRDTGPGIPDYARERIFERFYSLPRPGSERKGTGLGLPLVREIVDLHGGRVTIDGSGPGTQVDLHLPCGENPS